MKPDFTVVIPTIPGRTESLRQVLEALAQQRFKDFRVVVVWDAEGACPRVHDGLNLDIHYGSNGRNCGLATGRNTGVGLVDTPLAMFLDDDLIPLSDDFLSLHRDFHQENPDPMAMALGNVTWDGHPTYNGVMAWFEGSGGFSLFHKLADGERSAVFLGGITSFKTETMRRYPSNQSFRMYGGEDHELGFRLFNAGGSLVFLERAKALHLKDIDAPTYYRDHVGAGFSMGTILEVQPDSAMHPRKLPWVLDLNRRQERVPALIELAENLAKPYRALNAGSLGHVMGLLSDFAFAVGFRRYAVEKHAGFEKVEQVILKSLDEKGGVPETVWKQATEFCPTMALLWIGAGGAADDVPAKRNYFGRALELMPHYAFVVHQLALTYAGEERGAVVALIRSFVENHGPSMAGHMRQVYWFRFAEALEKLGCQREALGLYAVCADADVLTQEARDIRARAETKVSLLH